MRRQKGISLAIETIVFIILAVTVMSVLLLFFTKTVGDTQTPIDREKERIILCGKFFSVYSCTSEPTDNKIIDKSHFMTYVLRYPQQPA